MTSSVFVYLCRAIRAEFIEPLQRLKCNDLKWVCIYVFEGAQTQTRSPPRWLHSCTTSLLINHHSIETKLNHCNHTSGPHCRSSHWHRGTAGRSKSAELSRKSASAAQMSCRGAGHHRHPQARHSLDSENPKNSPQQDQSHGNSI